MSITIQNLNKHFGAFHALKNINLNVPTGKLVSLLGPSGCGKTTLLRIIAGLETPTVAKFSLTGKTSPPSMCASAKSVSCSNTTPSSAT